MQKQPEPTPSPCPEHPVGQNPHREKQSLHHREECARRIHSVSDGREGQHCYGGMDRGSTFEGPSHPQLLFFISSQSWLGAVTLESWEQVPALPSRSHFPSPIMSCPQEAGGEVQKRVYAAQRTKLGRPRPEAVTVGGSWGDRTPDPLGAHICMGNPG